jgi:PilZ domain
MLLDRRKNSRQTFNRLGRFYSDLSGQHECMIVDLSEGGARLHTHTETPPVFALTILTDAGAIQKRCKVIWRLGHEVGVEFLVEEARAAFGR